MRFASIRTLLTRQSCRNPSQMRILWRLNCKVVEFVEDTADRRKPTWVGSHGSVTPPAPRRSNRSAEHGPGDRSHPEVLHPRRSRITQPRRPARGVARRRGTRLRRRRGDPDPRCAAHPAHRAHGRARPGDRAPVPTPQPDPTAFGGHLQPSTTAGAYGVVAGRFSSAASGRPICGKARCGHATRSHTRQPAPIGTAAAASSSGSPWEYTSLSA